MTPAGTNTGKMLMNTSYSEQHKAKAAQKAQQRFENMEDSYQPSNPNPLNIEIGPNSGSHRVLEEVDTIGDVEINDNFSIG